VADKAFVKRWPDGRPVIVTQLTETEARVKIGDEYQILSIEQWRQLPLWKHRDEIAR
jgi:hypothetical protein